MNFSPKTPYTNAQNKKKLNTGDASSTKAKGTKPRADIGTVPAFFCQNQLPYQLVMVHEIIYHCRPAKFGMVRLGRLPASKWVTFYKKK